MRYRAAIALVAAVLIVPAFAQHSSAHSGFSGHAGSAGHSGFAGHAGFAAHSGFSGLKGGSVSRPVTRGGFGSGRVGFGRPGFVPSNPAFRSGFGAPYARRPGMLNPGVPYRSGMNAFQRSGSRSSYRGMHINPYQPGLQSGLAHRTGNWDHDRYRDSYHGDHRRGGDHHRRDYDEENLFAGSFVYPYPGYLGYPYPYVIDPGFYDWSDSSDSESEQGYALPDQGYGAPAYDQAPPEYGYAAPEYGAEPYTPQDQALDTRPAANSAPRASQRASVSNEAELNPPLTVIFKDGRKSEQIQNYMLSATVLTDLDRQHYEEIPLDQINVAATQQANRNHGIDFRVPTASHD